MPDQVAGEAGRFVDKSFLRKVAHIQDLDAARSGTSDPIRPVPFNTYDHLRFLPLIICLSLSLSLILLFWVQATSYGELEVCRG
ncbi:hypothetical protein MUK42_18627 [Musa troglodytarum]|uniref:Uncharacterized protein n=1 Tax=Musa troglodytarum TaxID=320322 RepID=A0A9E7EKL2_9LILI|nr:hypothetical protein MUK42_18627 [Musa troglodytarum]